MVWWTRLTHPLLWGRSAHTSGTAAGARRSAALARRYRRAFETWNTLREWTADLHARVGGRYIQTRWRRLTWSARHRWIYLEVEHGTAKLRRYAHYYISGSWRREYVVFFEVRIVTAHRPRVRRMLVEVEDAVRSFSRADHDAPMVGLVVAVTWELAFLADPSGAVWAAAFADGRREPLLAPSAGRAVHRIGTDQRSRECLLTPDKPPRFEDCG